MWFVNIGDKNSAGYDQWHFVADAESPRLACGIANPPWYLWWEGGEWHIGERVRGVAVAKKFDEPVRHDLLQHSDKTRCARCWRALDVELSRLSRAQLVASKMAQGLPEVTLGSLVTLVDNNEEKVRFYFQARQSPPEDAEYCSPESAAGKAILGRFVGDESTVYAPDGPMTYRIVCAHAITD